MVFDPAGIAAVRIETGIVWLTQERDPGDHFLATGDSHALAARGSVCIEARRPTVLALLAPMSQPGAFHALHASCSQPSRKATPPNGVTAPSQRTPVSASA
jgi:hypothetical protein